MEAPSGLDALANAAVLGDNISDMVEFSAGSGAAATTTKHPRHRPGCSCIVCIQPPSGKGKHEPACKCNVCLTVRRRFKTLMMRKKKRQSEREAELAQESKERDKVQAKAELEKEEDLVGLALLNMNEAEIADKVGLDLNCDPRREEEIAAEGSAMGLAKLAKAGAAFAADAPSLGPCVLSRAAAEDGGAAEEEEEGGDE